MGVTFDINRTEEGPSRQTDRACFGMLACLEDEGYCSGDVKSITFYPMHRTTCGWNQSSRNKKSAKVWWDYLLTLPVVIDSVVESQLDPSIRRNLSVEVRADIPADRLIQTLALFRIPHVSGHIADVFYQLTKNDVEPDIAFVVSQAMLTISNTQERKVDGVYIGAYLSGGWDNEHGILAGNYFGVDDLKGVVGELLTDRWEENYGGDQDVFQDANEYDRGYIVDVSPGSSERCLTRWATRHGHSDTKSLVQLYKEHKGISDRARSSELAITTIEGYLEVASFVEGLLNE